MSATTHTAEKHAVGIKLWGGAVIPANPTKDVVVPIENVSLSIAKDVDSPKNKFVVWIQRVMWRLFGFSPAENTYYAGPVGFTAQSENLHILEDSFRSGYECERCEESGKLPCPDCVDGTSKLNPEIRCKTCAGEKHVTCPDCNGKGALLHIPEVSKRRPTTGEIVSVGRKVKYLWLGDKVCYPNFCGEVFDLHGVDGKGREVTVVMRVLKEKEIISLITGHMELRRTKRIQHQITG